ncbi:MAG: antitoxin [Caulobacter sp.]
MSNPRPPGFEEAPVEFDADYDEHSAAADADVAAGRVVPHSEVRKWLMAVGTLDEYSMPKSWLR